MQNRDLKTLRMIARTGSFREAADRLNMTLSAVSMQMKSLETTLGAALFDRTTRPPKLTPLGRAVADRAGDVLDAEAALRALAGPDAPLAGRFRLGLVASAGPRFLPRFLQTAPGALPYASFDFRTGLSEWLEDEVASRSLDAAVLTATGTPPGGLRHHVLARDRLVAAARPGLPETAPFLHFAPSTGIGRLIAAALVRRPDLAARPRIVLDHLMTIRACLESGAGATILPEIDLEGMEMLRDPLPDTRTLVLATAEGTALDREATRLANLLAG